MRVKRVRLWDHFSYSAQLQVAEPQPHHGLVQINSYRRGKFVISLDVKRADLIKSLEAVLNVTITPNEDKR